jgi:hypothetical protein
MRATTDAQPSSEIALLAPVDGRTEVWAAGVTYEPSKDARISESQHEADVYDRSTTPTGPSCSSSRPPGE